MIDDHRDQKVKVTVRFFNIDDAVIHTTDKTEIEIDDEVIIYYFLVENLYTMNNSNSYDC